MVGAKVGGPEDPGGDGAGDRMAMLQPWPTISRRFHLGRVKTWSSFNHSNHQPPTGVLEVVGLTPDMPRIKF